MPGTKEIASSRRGNPYHFKTHACVADVSTGQKCTSKDI